MIGDVTHSDGESDAVDPDAQLVGGVAAVVVGQMLHELCQIHSAFAFLPKIIQQLDGDRRF